MKICRKNWIIESQNEQLAAEKAQRAQNARTVRSFKHKNQPTIKILQRSSLSGSKTSQVLVQLAE